MGYTHYFSTEHCTEEDIPGLQKALPIIKDILKRHADILCYEFNQPRKRPVVNGTEIHFNGRGEDGHETFRFRVSGGWEFCKTARKPYDMAVCECLLALSAFLPNLSVDSDGFSGHLAEQTHSVHLDGTWDQAIENVRKLYDIRYHAEITRKREPYCDLGLVLDKVDATTALSL